LRSTPGSGVPPAPYAAIDTPELLAAAPMPQYTAGLL